MLLSIMLAVSHLFPTLVVNAVTSNEDETVPEMKEHNEFLFQQS